MALRASFGLTLQGPGRVFEVDPRVLVGAEKNFFPDPTGTLHVCHWGMERALKNFFAGPTVTLRICHWLLVWALKIMFATSFLHLWCGPTLQVPDREPFIEY